MILLLMLVTQAWSVDIRVRVGRGIESSLLRAVDLKIDGRVVKSPIEFRCGENTKKISASSPAGMIHWNGKLYRKQLDFYPTTAGCDVVNVLDIETYLDGLVNTEFNSKWSVESVKAQVVVARTYALYQTESARKSKRHYDLDSSTDDQVYDGFIKEDFVSSRAVDQTRGQVLKFKGKLFSTYYHSTCGGLTELPEFVWGTKHPVYRERVRCESCVSSPKYKWNVSLSADVILGKLKLPPGECGIRLELNSKSGRVKRVVITRSGNVLKSLSGVEFRNHMGPVVIPSTRFDVIQNGNQFEFRGGGYGHGVGLCQWGAKVLGEQGKTHAEILKRYYPMAMLSAVH